jgi:hypothetical protein
LAQICFIGKISLADWCRLRAKFVVSAEGGQRRLMKIGSTAEAQLINDRTMRNADVVPKNTITSLATNAFLCEPSSQQVGRRLDVGLEFSGRRT